MCMLYITDTLYMYSGSVSVFLQAIMELSQSQGRMRNQRNKHTKIVSGHACHCMHACEGLYIHAHLLCWMKDMWNIIHNCLTYIHGPWFRRKTMISQRIVCTCACNIHSSCVATSYFADAGDNEYLVVNRTYTNASVPRTYNSSKSPCHHVLYMYLLVMHTTLSALFGSSL